MRIGRDHRAAVVAIGDVRTMKMIMIKVRRISRMRNRNLLCIRLLIISRIIRGRKSKKENNNTSDRRFLRLSVQKLSLGIYHRETTFVVKIILLKPIILLKKSY